MRVESWPRLIIVSLFALALATVLALQAISSVTTRTAPELSASTFLANGLALEQVAFGSLTTSGEGAEQEIQVSPDAFNLAMESVAKEPLTPRSHVVLALRATDAEARGRILAAAERLNGRDSSLQGVVLEQRLAALDYNGSIGALDRILRVNPERSQEFFPALILALNQAETLPRFAELLDNSSPWHSRFLDYAVRQRASLPNLALLRPEIEVLSPTFDRQLVAGLAGQGDVEGAEAIYRQVAGNSEALVSEGVIDWRSDFPPFEWRFVDEAGFRSQQSLDGRELEISVRPGKGGIIAARLLRTPDGPFRVRANNRVAPVDQLRDVRLQLICASTTTPFFDERFSRQGDGFVVEQIPEDCPFLVLAINARAWSGRSALSGTIAELEITAL